MLSQSLLSVLIKFVLAKYHSLSFSWSSMVLRFEKLARVASSAPSSFTFAFKPSFSAGESLFVVEKVQRVYRRLETLTWLPVDRLHKSQPLWPEGRGENPPLLPRDFYSRYFYRVIHRDTYAHNGLGSSLFRRPQPPDLCPS